MEYMIYKSNELYHHGILGMKWGVRRYQNKDGSLTAAGRKRYDDQMAKIEAKTQKLRNKQEVAAKKKAIKDARQNLRNMRQGKKSEAEQAEMDIETKKAKILESRSAKALYDNANLFSFQELNAAKMRLELERNIKNMEPATVSKGKAAANRFTESADTLSNVLQSGSKAYNNMARVFNSLYGNKKGLTLPLITDNAKSKLDKYKEETDWIEAKNKRKKAEEEAGEKKKSALEKLKDETAWIDAQNKNREAKRASRAHDESDAKEAAKKQKAADEAAKKAQRDKDMEDYNNFQEQYKKSTDLPENGQSSTYRNAGVDGSRTNVNPSNARALPSGNAPLGLPSGTSNRTYSSVKNDPSTSSGRATVQRLLGSSDSDSSMGDKLMTYDESGNFVGFWSDASGETL